MDAKPCMVTVAVSRDELENLQDLLDRCIKGLNYRELDSPYNSRQWRTVRRANASAAALIKRFFKALEKKQAEPMEKQRELMASASDRMEAEEPHE